MEKTNESKKEEILTVSLEYGEYPVTLKDNRKVVPHKEIGRGEMIAALDKLVYFITTGKKTVMRTLRRPDASPLDVGEFIAAQIQKAEIKAYERGYKEGSGDFQEAKRQGKEEGVAVREAEIREMILQKQFSSRNEYVNEMIDDFKAELLSLINDKKGASPDPITKEEGKI